MSSTLFVKFLGVGLVLPAGYAAYSNGMFGGEFGDASEFADGLTSLAYIHVPDEDAAFSDGPAPKASKNASLVNTLKGVGVVSNELKEALEQNKDPELTDSVTKIAALAAKGAEITGDEYLEASKLAYEIQRCLYEKEDKNYGIDINEFTRENILEKLGFKNPFAA